MNSRLESILDMLGKKLLKSIQHLEYSQKKVASLPTKLSHLDEESLETWEGFSARFSRVADIYLGRYLRTKALLDDPAFSGSFRDLLNYAEKFGWIDNTETWFRVRSLRNVMSHEYIEEELEKLLRELRDTAPLLIQLKEKI
jgi:hypothetical protein